MEDIFLHALLRTQNSMSPVRQSFPGYSNTGAFRYSYQYLVQKPPALNSSTAQEIYEKLLADQGELEASPSKSALMQEAKKAYKTPAKTIKKKRELRELQKRYAEKIDEDGKVTEEYIDVVTKLENQLEKEAVEEEKEAVEEEKEAVEEEKEELDL